MNETRFRKAVHLGLGRAIRFAQEHDVRQFREIILDACLHCYAVDVQSEGTRAPFMLELVESTRERDFYCDAVLKGLAGAGDDSSGLQRFNFATYLAMDGDLRAKEHIYQHFAPGPRWGEDIGVNLVRLDGGEGFLVAARAIGRLLVTGQKTADDGWLWHVAQETLGSPEAKAALEVESQSDPDLAAYLASVSAKKTGGSTLSKLVGLSYPELCEELPGSRPIQLQWRARKAEAGDIEAAARGLMAATAPSEQIQHLQFFAETPFPGIPSQLIRWSSGGDEQLARAATIALTNVPGPAIRELAFQLVQEQRPSRGTAIRLLARNYEVGDEATALSWFLGERDPDTIHEMGMGLRDFRDMNLDPARETQILLALYEHGSCSFCRGTAVHRLIEMESLPAAIRDECLLDTNEDIRELAGAGPTED